MIDVFGTSIYSSVENYIIFKNERKLPHVWLHIPPFRFSFFLFPLSFSARVQFDVELFKLIKHIILSTLS